MEKKPPPTSKADASVTPNPSAEPEQPEVGATQEFTTDNTEAADILPTDEDTAASEDVASPHQQTAAFGGDAVTAAGEDSAKHAPLDGKPRPQTKTQKIVNFSDYKLLNKLGEGGMGAVYKAHQISLDREVALKILGKHLSAKPKFVQRFLREARVMARLDHPNILRCFEIKQEHGYHYYAMEYVEGGSLEGWLKKLGKFSVGDALYITLACARALEHAHDFKLIHRDMKPDNVLLTKRGVVKVADMGLVKALEEDMSLTESGVGVGTPHYMAPEQTRNAKHADARSDIYALGCMFYRLLTGKLPFTGQTIAELLEAKQNSRVPPAHKENPAVPPRLDLILDKMMARQPDHRYQSCTELIEDLENLGLESPTLSFLAPQDQTGARRSGSHPSLPRAGSRSSASRPTVPEPSAPMSTSQTALYESQAEDTELRWYLSVKDKNGRLTTRKLTTGGVIGLIKIGEVDPETPASNELNGGYRPLSSYPQFQTLLRPKSDKDKANRKTVQFRQVYEQLDRDDKKRKRWRWLRDLGISIGGFVKLLFWLALLGGIAVGAYFLIMWGIEWLKAKGDDLQNRPEKELVVPGEPKGGR